MKRAPNLAQDSLPFTAPQALTEPRKKCKTHFVDDSPYDLHMGEQRLDEYLRARGLGWVVRLRQELEKLDYTDLLVAYEGMGRRPYHPRSILGLIVYGILKRQWSLRELEDLAASDLGAWWICGGVQPDHSTIGDFIERHSKVLSAEFVATVIGSLVKRLRLQPGVVAGDGTTIEAAASHYQTLKVEAAQQAAQAARQALEATPEDPKLQAAADKAGQVAAVANERKERRARQGKPTDKVRVSPQEPEAVLQPRKDGAMRLAYKPSTLVHESGLIVGQVVHPSSETAVVAELLDQHVSVFGANPSTALFDAGYCQPAVLEEMVERDIDALIPSGKATDEDSWQKRGNKGRFGKNAFEYDEHNNVYTCPAGQELNQSGRGRDTEGRQYRLYATTACPQCSMREQCTTSTKGRKIKRYEGEEYKEAMAVVLNQPGARRQYALRRTLGERSFAVFREQQDLKRFHRFGLRGARVEFALHVIAFDLRWAIRRSSDAVDPSMPIFLLVWTRIGGEFATWRPTFAILLFP